MIPESIQVKIFNNYKGRSIKDLEYILNVTEGYYECQKINRQLKKLK